MIKFPLAAAMLAMATTALAQTPAAAGGLSFDQWSAHARERLMALDTDHDGKISKAEFAAGPMMMGRHRKGGATDDANAPKPDGARMFDRLDANHDGYLDPTEINAMLARRFARQDANHDGVLTPDERHAMRGMSAPEQ
jgi:Ca2+-binding EF-hand superfamily protein